jgi:hypothetical protein
MRHPPERFYHAADLTAPTQVREAAGSFFVGAVKKTAKSAEIRFVNRE